MTVLSLVTPPPPLLTVAEVQEHLRAPAGHEDGLYAHMLAGAEALIDGWTGILGRAVLSQVWRQDFTGSAGRLRLAMMDVVSVEVKAFDGAGDLIPGTVWTLGRDACGWYVDLTAPAAERSEVECTCAMPVHLVPRVKAAVKMILGHWNLNREAVTASTMSEMPLGAMALLQPLRRVVF